MTEDIFDVVVIGGGPSGMMAAGRAGELGAKVLLLEKNSSLGEKLLLTGKGRGNISRAEFDLKELAKGYGREGDFFLSALSAFGPKETMEFFEKRGLRLKIERGKRVFPRSNSAANVLRVLLNYLRKGKVEIMTDSQVKKLALRGKRIGKVVLKDGKEIHANNFIICTGGKAFPGTGSTGEGYVWLGKMGHTIIRPKPALVPLKIKESWPRSLQGLSLKNVELTVWQDGKKKDSRFGEMLFTHFGISGPIVLDLSGRIGELLEKDKVRLVLDLKPALNFQTLDKRLQSDFLKHSSKLFKNSLDDLLPQKLIPLIIKLSGINPEKKTNEIEREERLKLLKLLKGLEMEVFDTLGFGHAIVTLGGVSLREIEAKTMKSKIIENLYLAGEVINLHGPTGGYNLLQSWITGYLAGQSAVEALTKNRP
ncbi:MAG: NAD(P)/FAD-dependent oxidoreductase [bacterium]|nr:NAD(P)/FAD-dependent oxidoreductase [bacterium]